MATLASERSWLFDPARLKLVHQCRRLIQTEFGVRLHLTEEHLEQRLAEYARKSRSSGLNRIWKTLQEQVPELRQFSPPPTATKTNTLRGQSIATHDEDSGRDNRPVKTIIYRGQVITR